MGPIHRRQALFEKICWALFILGIIWFLSHPAVTISSNELKCRRTYISENELLIDTIQAQIGPSHVEKVLETHRDLRFLQKSKAEESARQWIVRNLQEVSGVQVYQQTYIQSAVNASKAHANVYGILKAIPLADHKESILIVVEPYGESEDVRYSGFSIGLELLRHLSTVKWLAKDVILLCPEDKDGLKEWLLAYHADPVESTSSYLPKRAGVLRAGLYMDAGNVDATRTSPKVSLLVAGRNGQLPNLDLINVAVRSFQTEKIPSVSIGRCQSLNDAYTSPNQCSDFLTRIFLYLDKAIARLSGFILPDSSFRNLARSYLSNLYGMLGFMSSLAFSSNGPHAELISYSIDSITLDITQSETGVWTATDGSRKFLHSILRGTELIIRSLSNLEEKLHQSFFFYVLPSPWTFVSIGEYFFPLFLLAAPLLFELLRIPHTTTDMRVAFGLLTLTGAEVFAMSLHRYHTMYDFICETTCHSVYVWLWIVYILLGEGVLVWYITRKARCYSMLQGSCGELEWIKQMKTNQELVQAQLVDKRPPQKNIHTTNLSPDEGWQSICFLTMLLVGYGNLTLGLINYPMSFFCSVFTCCFALVRPHFTVAPLRRIFISIWLALTSPAILVWASVYFFDQAWRSSLNAVAVAYFYILYVPAHCLATCVFLFPPQQAQK